MLTLTYLLFLLLLLFLLVFSSNPWRPNQARNQPSPKQQQGNQAQHALIPYPQKAVARYGGGNNLWSQVRGRQRDQPMGYKEEGHQKKSCRPGRAMIDLSYVGKDAGHRNYSIKCVNFTQSCQEKCLYALSCTVKQFGQNLYVRGIYSIYDRFTNRQVYFLFLCCNTTMVPEGRRCTNTKQEKGGAPMQTTGQYSFREASTTFPDGCSPLTLISTTGKFYIELCFNTRPKKGGIMLCPLLQLLNNQQSQASNAFDPSLSGALLGMLGTVGLALIKPTLTPPRPCCCQYPPVCSGQAFQGCSGGVTNINGITLEACRLGCLSDTMCAAIDYEPSGSSCFKFTPAGVTQCTSGLVPVPTVSYCFKC